MARRVRNHVNPLAFVHDVDVPNFPAFFGRKAPIELDAGCADGRFLLERAANHPERDFVGMEIRQPMVVKAGKALAEVGLRNVCFVHCNANFSLAPSVDPGSLVAVHVQFPDPWFKAKHHKRRVINQDFLRDCWERLAPGGTLYWSTDVCELAEEMIALTEASGYFRNTLAAHAYQRANPLPERSAWERHLEAHGRPIWRAQYERLDEPVAQTRLVAVPVEVRKPTAAAPAPRPYAYAARRVSRR